MNKICGQKKKGSLFFIYLMLIRKYSYVCKATPKQMLKNSPAKKTKKKEYSIRNLLYFFF